MATLPLRQTPVSQRGITRAPQIADTSVDRSGEQRAMENLGATVANFGETIQKEQDASAIFAARRQLDDWERKTIYDPQAGAMSKKGADAFDLPKVIPEEFDKAASEIGKSLQGDRQRRAFEELATSRRAQVGDWAARHSTQQRQVYNEGQYNADIDSGLNRAAMLASAGDFNTAKAEVGLMQTRTTGYLRSLGKSEEEIGVAVRNVASKANVTAINMLLEKDRPMEADKYLKDNAASMNVEDLLRAQAAVGKSVAAHQGLVDATEIVQNAVKPAIAPTDSGRLVNLVIKAESGGQRYGKDGKLLESPKGAKGEMQVMDATNLDPGYGVKPAKDSSPEERARVGRDYLDAMVKEFKGDIPMALAAYNAGPGAVQKAVEAANKQRTSNWLGNMPAETQAYVAKITKEYGAGAGAPAMPTLQDLHAQVREKVGMDNPQRYKTAIEEVNRQYKDMLDAKKSGEEAVVTSAFDWLVKNKGDYARLPASLMANLPPGKVDEVITFAGKIADGVPIKTDWDTYTQLRAMATTDPAKFGKVDLRTYYPTIAPAQREQLVDLQTKVKDPKQQPTVMALAGQLSIAHNQLALTGAGNAAKRGMFDNAVTQAIADEQADKKRELTFEERDKIIKRMQLPVAGSGGWFSSDKKLFQVAGTSAEVGAKLKVDDEARKLITAALKSEGAEVTDAAIQARFNLRHGIR
jgi:soluble lytic murein transglycosylase-like protein